jgi:hypothetical protein
MARLAPDHRRLVHRPRADHEVLLKLLEVVQGVPGPEIRVQVDVGVAVRLLEPVWKEYLKQEWKILTYLWPFVNTVVTWRIFPHFGIF